MTRKWLVGIGLLNIVAILFAATNLVTDFAILAPTRLKYDLGDLKSIKGAIFQAESGGIEMMRRYALVAVAVLTLVLIANFVTLCVISRRKNQTQKKA